MLQVDSLNHLRINLASPLQIRQWATRKTRQGENVKAEVVEPQTMHYRTRKPVPGGLFCQKIFGPVQDFKCSCGRYAGTNSEKRYRGKICRECGVEVTVSLVRRRRMAVIELAYPVVHTWFFFGRPNKIATLLGLKIDQLKMITYTDQRVPVKLPSGKWKSITGGAAIKHYLLGMDDVKRVLQICRSYVFALRDQKNSKTKIAAALKRIRILEQFRCSGVRPSWMMLEAFPVLPPDLRPMLVMEGVSSGFVSADVNDLYKTLIIRNNRTTRLKSRGRGMSVLVLENESRMLQHGVDAVIDNSKQLEPTMDSSGQPKKSLSDIIRGKEGRFRKNLLGKRVDYSGRSVIVAGPELSAGQCGLPREMAVELFRPYVLHRLMSEGVARAYWHAVLIIDTRGPTVWEILSRVTFCRPVILNRAPTLHRMGMQAFYPVLSSDEVIRLHPFACPGFNADFDGDQMGVHIPLGLEAQSEAVGMMSLHRPGALRQQYSAAFFGPSQDMVMAAYAMTCPAHNFNSGSSEYFPNFDSVISALRGSCLRQNTPVWVRYPELLEEITLGDFMSDPGLLVKRNKGLTVCMTKMCQLRIYSERKPTSPQQKDGKFGGSCVYAYVKTTAGSILLNRALRVKV